MPSVRASRTRPGRDLQVAKLLRGVPTARGVCGGTVQVSRRPLIAAETSVAVFSLPCEFHGVRGVEQGSAQRGQGAVESDTSCVCYQFCERAKLDLDRVSLVPCLLCEELIFGFVTHRFWSCRSSASPQGSRHRCCCCGWCEEIQTCPFHGDREGVLGFDRISGALI